MERTSHLLMGSPPVCLKIRSSYEGGYPPLFYLEGDLPLSQWCTSPSPSPDGGPPPNGTPPPPPGKNAVLALEDHAHNTIFRLKADILSTWRGAEGVLPLLLRDCPHHLNHNNDLGHGS